MNITIATRGRVTAGVPVHLFVTVSAGSRIEHGDGDEGIRKTVRSAFSDITAGLPRPPVVSAETVIVRPAVGRTQIEMAGEVQVALLAISHKTGMKPEAVLAKALDSAFARAMGHYLPIVEREAERVAAAEREQQAEREVEAEQVDAAGGGDPFKRLVWAEIASLRQRIEKLEAGHHG